MTLYLLDTNVLREFTPNGHRNVRAWLGTVDDSALRISVMTLLEMRRGWEAMKSHDPRRAAEGLKRLLVFEAGFVHRIIPIDAPIVAEWARLVGEKDKHRRQTSRWHVLDFERFSGERQSFPHIRDAIGVEIAPAERVKLG